MNIETLKRAADFLGVETFQWHKSFLCIGTPEGFLPEDDTVTFNPYQESGAHWLKKMELKLSLEQWRRYEALIIKEWKEPYTSPELFRWFKTAPTELCFEKIMEVI